MTNKSAANDPTYAAIVTQTCVDDTVLEDYYVIYLCVLMFVPDGTVTYQVILESSIPNDLVYYVGGNVSGSPANKITMILPTGTNLSNYSVKVKMGGFTQFDSLFDKIPVKLKGVFKPCRDTIPTDWPEIKENPSYPAIITEACIDDTTNVKSLRLCTVIESKHTDQEYLVILLNTNGGLVSSSPPYRTNSNERFTVKAVSLSVPNSVNLNNFRGTVKVLVNAQDSFDKNYQEIPLKDSIPEGSCAVPPNWPPS